jgi:ribosomal protein S18 acetylase RimI-like enzyme
MTVRPARIPEEVDLIRGLFREYAAGLGVDLCFQRFEEELAGLPGAYAPPGGRLLLACDGDRVAGCVALRPATGGGEMKRLYVRPEFRGRGVGRLLAGAVLVEAAAAGYRRVCLDTLPSMGEAIGLYRSLGFAEVEPYYPNPVPGALFLARDL